MSKETENKIGELALWFKYNSTPNMDPVQFVKFATVALDVLGEIVGRLAGDVQALERRDGNEELRKRLLVPRGVKLHDPVRS